MAPQLSQLKLHNKYHQQGPNSRHFFLMALEERSPDQGSGLVPDENPLLSLQRAAFLLCPQWQTMRETASPLVSPLIKTLILNLIVSLNPSSSDTIALEVRASAYDFVGNTIQCTAIVILKYTWLTAMWPYILSSRSTC